MQTTSGSHRVTSSGDGNLRFSTPLSLLLLAPIFAWIGAGVGVAGIRAIAGGAAAGIVPVLFAIAWLAILFAQLRAASSIRFDESARLVRFRWPSMSVARLLLRYGTGGRTLRFEAIESVAVTSDPPDSRPLAILLKGSADEIPLGSGWSTGDAGAIARAIAERTGCAAGVRFSAGERALAPLPPAPSAESESRPRWLVVLQSAAFGVGLFGLLAFLAGFVIHGTASDRLDGFEVPLGDAVGLAVDADGRIYVGSRAYGRIQRYGADGRFDRGWALRAGRGSLALEARGGGIAVWVGDRVRATIDGEDRLQVLSDPPPADAATPGPETTRDRHGTLYRLESSFLGPVSVVRVDADRSETVVRQHVLLWLAQSPLPAWLFAFAGLLFHPIGGALRRTAPRPRTQP